MTEKRLATDKRIDPDPFTIYAAIVATYAAGVATVNFVITRYPPLPAEARARLLSSLKELDDHAKSLRADLRTIEDIFRNAKFAKGRTIRLDNGAELTRIDFSRYEKVADNVLVRLRKVYKLSLKVERQATKLDALEMAPTTNIIGDTYARLDKLLQTKNLSMEKAWQELHAIADGLDLAIDELRKQLGAK